MLMKVVLPYIFTTKLTTAAVVIKNDLASAKIVLALMLYFLKQKGFETFFLHL